MLDVSHTSASPPTPPRRPQAEHPRSGPRSRRPVSTSQRSTTTRDRHRAAIRRLRPPCALCDADIDYNLRSPHPMSFVVDHIIPLALGGTDELDNKQPAHRVCNERKAAKHPDQTKTRPVPRQFVTTRTW
ncbi:HNH endonuclease [Nocardia rhizosphaerae]|uniref:HNH endonuclease n=1 Tax=Nocardia rhizosphaerae TaxID=1691571 RepID=A0ABV8L2X8_9NOCA